VAVSPREVNADRLRTAVDQVLTTPSFTERARGLADSLAKAGGAVRAADLILSATRSGQSQQQQHDGMATTCGGS